MSARFGISLPEEENGVACEMWHVFKALDDV